MKEQTTLCSRPQSSPKGGAAHTPSLQSVAHHNGESINVLRTTGAPKSTSPSQSTTSQSTSHPKAKTMKRILSYTKSIIWQLPKLSLTKASCSTDISWAKTARKYGSARLKCGANWSWQSRSMIITYRLVRPLIRLISRLGSLITGRSDMKSQ